MTRLSIYEINTAVWLGGHSLADVPAKRWDAIAALPVDAVWLMGVWRRSPAGLAIAAVDDGLSASFRAALTDLRPGDVIGSPYCVRDYVVDERFGGREGLAVARHELAARGLRLILDYVPNHVAPDHPWLASNPEYFIRGTEAQLAERPADFVRTAGGIVARGRDPYFPPWPDVVQLDAFNDGLRSAVAETLVDVGAQCDGLRCDMAMLMISEVFAGTWGVEPHAEEFWPQLITRVKWTHPGLLFIAEAYWDMEFALMEQGFDLCYDKRLYDRLVERGDVRGHLTAPVEYQERLVRFIENHDEPRAASVFGPEQARAAAVVMSTLPGARLYHDGQLSGRRAHVPVFLGRGPDEPPDAELRAFYAWLLPRAARLQGTWRLLESEPPLVSWAWDDDVVVVNLSDEPAGGLPPWGFQLG
ncbi:alpha-amylase [Solirubrobacter sp. CPCC 204708]|uniref:Alpha-amylase family glycosyl hydrolase n=1 Tax=Solirubrobacter deserti TaxID=2282478 RepID=A0ABT4RTU9_9ACTN|nr:alpha-amylase family glycosyl hydrolase [Solirubrobacter deserti]MBE2318691.1 alpha-amylase [Solirubrobacter deserti]MDA0141998.1 alpha-amylase family glycosyl hydrolase [Solirubrobacter deserti]